MRQRGKPRERRERKGRYPPRRRVCIFCADKNKVVDYKDVSQLRRFLSDRARIEPRHRSSLCAKHQRAVTRAIKRARHLAFLPFTGVQLRETGGFRSMSIPAPAAAPVSEETAELSPVTTPSEEAAPAIEETAELSPVTTPSEEAAPSAEETAELSPVTDTSEEAAPAIEETAELSPVTDTSEEATPPAKETQA